MVEREPLAESLRRLQTTCWPGLWPSEGSSGGGTAKPTQVTVGGCQLCKAVAGRHQFLTTGALHRARFLEACSSRAREDSEGLVVGRGR